MAYGWAHLEEMRGMESNRRMALEYIIEKSRQQSAHDKIKVKSRETDQKQQEANMI